MKIIGTLLFLLLSSCSNETATPESVRLKGVTMGTTYSMTIPVLPEGIEPETVKVGVEQLLVAINQSMSTYIINSELSQLNQSKSIDWVNLSDQLYTVIDQAQMISSRSNGAFDITVAPLVNLWGFGPEKSIGNKPSEDAIQQRLQQIGYQKIELRQSPRAIKKIDSAIEIDLSALAKGYGVDQIANYLASLGIEDYMVEIGGEIHLNGKNGHGTPWRIAIEKPAADQRSIQRVLLLESGAIATSGDYRNYFEKDGKRYSHTIDPRTGRPITHTLASVSVIAESTMKADGWATALMVLGAE